MKPRIYINKVIQDAVNHFTVELIVLNPIDKVDITMTLYGNEHQ